MLQPDPSSVGARGPTLARARTLPRPFAQVYGLESTQGRRLALASLLALAVHSGVALRSVWVLQDLQNFARAVRWTVHERLRASIEVAVEPEPEPEPVPEPQPEPEQEPEPVKKAEAKPALEKAPAPPAPVAAQAARVLTAEPDPNEPLDLTGDSFVQGNADVYAGGITAAKGTATQAVRSPRARGDGVVGGTGTAPATGVDRSRPAGTLQKNWDCPFPAEAELEQVNYQQVNVAVTVAANGKALEVKVIGNTSFGFGRAAQRCALSKTFVPALDRSGTPVTTTIPIVVTFVRR
jgi:protein TonB